MMEYASDGTLMTRLKGTEEFVSKSIDQVLDAAAYMHRNRVVHRDIKPENIVICLGVLFFKM
jgi:serine/threonine protein kinase